jgi:hypothetical protein
MEKATEKLRVLISMPPDVREFLQARARFNGGSLSGEVVRNAREKMEAERAKGQAAAASE